MSNTAIDPVHLRRIDPERNMQRYYSFSIQPTLFGDASLIRHWGRIGTLGQSLVQTFNSTQEANRALSRIEQTKRQRGYFITS